MFKQALWVIGILRAAGAVVVLSVDIVQYRGIIPGPGASVTFGSILSGSYVFGGGWPMDAVSWLVFGICTVGLLLYDVDGALGWALNGDANESVAVAIDVNCTTIQGFTPGSCGPADSVQVFHYWTLGDWLARIGWAAGAFYFSFFVLIPVLLPLLWRSLAGGCKGGMVKLVQDAYDRRVKVAIYYVVVIGGLAAIAGAGMNAGGETMNASPCVTIGGYDACHQLQFILPGSVSGFWDLWVQNWTAVAKSLFTW
jgi:hypothetical protein